MTKRQELDREAAVIRKKIEHLHVNLTAVNKERERLERYPLAYPLGRKRRRHINELVRRAS